ncbi:MAG: bifunctional enoyl-CoA hydratase/phosphate acetyltransferase [Spongiibacteraceae bacterium]|nr:bifunctional enoyl-CoA hydratase/phosphate acetyltransferase [Spongiibacteraceae bacterium]
MSACALADAEGVDLSPFELVEAEHSHASAEKAVALVREGRGQILIKGSLHTEELLRAVVNRDTGLRTERRISHAYVIAAAFYHKPYILTDAAINIAPDLSAKADICRNAIELAHTLGVALPKLAILSAEERVTPRIPSTIEAAALCKMAERGQISGALLDGPLAFDNAFDRAAALTKGIHSEVAGDADIVLVPDLEAGNMLAKQMTYMRQAQVAGIVLGARVPIVLTSRSADTAQRLLSTALAALLHHRRFETVPA